MQKSQPVELKRSFNFLKRLTPAHHYSYHERFTIIFSANAHMDVSMRGDGCGSGAGLVFYESLEKTVQALVRQIGIIRTELE